MLVQGLGKDLAVSIKREIAAYKKDGLLLTYIGAHDPEQLAHDVRVPPEKAAFKEHFVRYYKVYRSIKKPFVNQFRAKRQPGAG